MQSYLQLWFPKEVKEKQAQNKKETAKEELEEMVSFTLPFLSLLLLTAIFSITGPRRPPLCGAVSRRGKGPAEVSI
jgi:hypothetical protein